MNLTVENVSKLYKQKIALKEVDLEFSSGIYGILGTNGSGKTTLMRILASVLKPSSGRVLLNGENIIELDQEYRKNIGYLPQQNGLYETFTAEKFLLYIAALKGLEKEEARQKTKEVLQLTGLEEYGMKKISKLSGGMKRRIGIAQALLNDPFILIVDEPTAGLDPKERIRFRNLLSQISSNRIVLLSTHIVSDIEYIAKEVLILKEGQVIKKKSPKLLLQEIGGYVWSLHVHVDEVSLYQRSFQIANLIQVGDTVELRIISQHRPHPKARQEMPNLEDLYLYFFDEEVKKHEGPA